MSYALSASIFAQRAADALRDDAAAGAVIAFERRYREMGVRRSTDSGR
jgi:hypothetical protein